MGKIIVDVTQGSLTSAYAEAPFDEAKEALEAEGYRIISLEEMARLRVQEGKSSNASRDRNWTREGFIYVPKKGVFLAPNSPIMDNAAEAVKCHRNGKEYSLSDEQVEKACADSIEIPFNQKPIPTNRFGDDEKTVFLFKEFAREYGEFLREAGISISEMPIYLADEDHVQKQTKPFATQAWLGSVDYRSVLGGFDYYGLCYGDWLRGVKDSAKLEKNSQESYAPNQILSVLKAEGVTGELEERILEKLRKIK